MKRLLIPLLGFTLCVSAAAESGYVQSRQAKLLEAPKFGSAVVTTLERGAEVEIISTEGRWSHVRHVESEGWVTRFLLTDKPPLGHISLLADEEQAEALVTNARTRASAVTSAGAARGLTTEDRQRASSSGMSNYFSVDIMEQSRVTEDEALRFLAEGVRP